MFISIQWRLQKMYTKLRLCVFTLLDGAAIIRETTECKSYKNEDKLSKILEERSLLEPISMIVLANRCSRKFEIYFREFYDLSYHLIKGPWK